jgi:DNA-binding GntR family transcriptional regulator
MGRPALPKSQRSAVPIIRRRSPSRRKSEALGAFAYRVLRDAIRSGKFRPGEHLRETDVADWLIISRTPVREAFHRMTSEGLVTNGPWNGVMIAELNERQLMQLYVVREALEGTAAALAAQNATTPDIEAIRAIVNTMEKTEDPKKLVLLNAKFHQTLYEASYNQYLLHALNSVVHALGLLRHSTFVLPGSVELAHSEHKQIVEAIRRHHPTDAENAARLHVRNALTMRLKLLSSGNGQS